MTATLIRAMAPLTTTPALRIILADDDPIACETTTELLLALGHDVVATATGGWAAVELALEHHPDAVLLDVHMPEGSGLEAAAELARALPGVAVVLVSGDAELRLADAYVHESTAVAYLSKPVPPASLDATLRLAVARGRALAAARREAAEARTELENRKVVERAKGVLMRRMGATEQEAYAVLRRSSQDRSLPMVEIARAVLDSEP